MVSDTEGTFPWQEQFSHPPHPTAARSDARADPYNVPEKTATSARSIDRPSNWRPQAEILDCFSRLPWEILEEIAIMLPTVDALKLRLASASYLCLLSSGTFWASRFRGSHERGCLFEKSRNRDITDWLSLYRLTSPATYSPGLRIRQRIWNLIRPLNYLTRLSIAKPLDDCYACPKLASGEWIEISGDLRPERLVSQWRPSYGGCHILGSHALLVPRQLSRVAITISSIGNPRYISGIRFISEQGADSCVGYISEDDEVMCEVTDLRGLRVAMSSRGIRALQLLGEDMSSSEWIGCPEGSPISERLAYFKSIGAVATLLMVETVQSEGPTSPF